METKGGITLYRSARNTPPSDREYRSPLDKGKVLRPELPDHVKEGWDALSSWDTEEGARRAAVEAATRNTNLGAYIVRYDIPDGVGVTWKQSGEPGHYELRGDKEVLKGCLAKDFLAEVGQQASEGEKDT